MTAITDRPRHQPEAVDAPVLGRNWYSGCDDTGGYVDPVTGLCDSCGKSGCVVCGRSACPDHFFEGDEVEYVTGPNVGERGFIDKWRFASLRYQGHEPDDPRVYRVLVHGDTRTRPAEAFELALVNPQ